MSDMNDVLLGNKLPIQDIGYLVYNTISSMFSHAGDFNPGIASQYSKLS
jgi:hypothetical protein